MAFLIKVFVIASLFFLLLIPSPANALETKTSPKKAQVFQFLRLLPATARISIIPAFLAFYKSTGH